MKERISKPAETPEGGPSSPGLLWKLRVNSMLQRADSLTKGPFMGPDTYRGLPVITGAVEDDGTVLGKRIELYRYNPRRDCADRIRAWIEPDGTIGAHGERHFGILTGVDEHAAHPPEDLGTFNSLDPQSELHISFVSTALRQAEEAQKYTRSKA